MRFSSRFAWYAGQLPSLSSRALVKRRGQGVVEYLLLLSVVVAVSLLFKTFFAPGADTFLRTQIGYINTRAWTGGRVVQDKDPFGGHYYGGQGACATGVGGQGCGGP